MPRPLRRRLLAAGALALVAPLAAPALPVSAADAPRPAGATDPVPADDVCELATEESPLRVEVTRLLPRAPSDPDEPVQIAGRLRNCGEEAATDLQLRLATGSVIRTRGELQRADDEPVLGVARLTEELAVEQLDPGETVPFDLRLRVRDLELGRSLGVYPLSLQARARYGEDRRRTGVGFAHTFVPWFPDGPPAPTRLAWLWPLVDEPRRAPAEVMLDDVLATLVSPGGRLQELLEAARAGTVGACEPEPALPPGPPADPAPVAPAGCRGEAVPITFGVDPSLLYSLEAMTRPYTVLVDGRPVDRPASEAAEAWLAALRDAAQDSDVLALPFGDPDVVALARVGSGLRDDVEQLRKLGQADVADLLEVPPLSSVAWPPPGPLTPALDVLLGGEAEAVVLDSTALPPAPVARSRTPNARRALPALTGEVTGLVVEDVLSDLVTEDAEQGARLAEQRFIAETALIAAERPSESRTLLVAPQRTAEVDPAVATEILRDTGRLPWLCAVPLADLAEGQERCAELPDEQAPSPAEEREPGDAEPPDDRDGELSPAFVAELSELGLAVDQFTEDVLVAGTEPASEAKRDLLRALGRAASAAWRDEPLRGARMLRLLEEHLALLRSQVRLVSEPVTLTGSTGVIRLNVVNGLDQPVSVGVVLDETSSARLSSSAADVQVVPGDTAVVIPVEVEPRTSGRFQAIAHLVDAEGRPFGEPVVLDVRSTRYGRVALAVTGVAAAVLMVAAGVRITRRALRRVDA